MRFTSCFLALLFGGLVFVSRPLYAQTDPQLRQSGYYLELNSWIYPFLEEQYVKKNLAEIFPDTKPVARMEVARAISKLTVNALQLNAVERSQLAAARFEFRTELAQIETAPAAGDAGYEPEVQTLKKPFESILPKFVYENNRNLASVDVLDFHATADLILGLGTKRGNIDTLAFDGTRRQKQTTFTNGFIFTGGLGHSVDFYLNFRDNTESGNILFTPVDATYPHLGFVQTTAPGKATHDEVIGYIKFNLPYSEIMFGKGSNFWGPAKSGSLTLSDNATSYNQLLLRTSIWKLKYTAIAAELIDYKYSFSPDTLQGKKYIAAHRLDFQPTPDITIGFWETMIYAGRTFEPNYLNPIIFYKSTEHYLGSPDNAQLGFDFSVRPFKNVKLYCQMYIDDLQTSKIGTGFWLDQLAWIWGVFLTNVGLPNTTLRGEFVWIEPYVYSHFDDNNYLQYGTNLGYNAPPNSATLFIELTHQFTKQLSATLTLNNLRHGANSDSTNYGGNILQPFNDQALTASQKAKWLAGIAEVTTQIDAIVRYELFRNFYINASVGHSTLKNIYSQFARTRQDASGNRFAFSVGWNL
jgi:hypothetical protein